MGDSGPPTGWTTCGMTVPVAVPLIRSVDLAVLQKWWPGC
jgi:hypothetical protein